MERVRTAPLSDQQEPMWLLHQLLPDVPADHESVTLILRGPLDVEALRGSLDRFVERHEIWRTVFVNADEGPRQVVQATGGLALTVRDIRALTAAEREAEALRLADDSARQPFDLARGPLEIGRAHV